MFFYFFDGTSVPLLLDTTETSFCFFDIVFFQHYNKTKARNG